MAGRRYPLPKAVMSSLDTANGPLVASIIANGAVLSDDLDRVAAVYRGTELGDWSEKVIKREAMKTLDKLLGDVVVLPVAVVDSDDIVVGLEAGDRVYDQNGWRDEILGPQYERIELEEDDIAFIADAFADGADGIVLRFWSPLAFITAAGEASPADAAVVDPAAPPADATAGLPGGSAVVAIVDEYDRAAVIELVAVAPGPKTFRRHAGAWEEDPAWLQKLRGVDIPPMVKLEAAQVGSVAVQVDEATAGEPFETDPAGEGIAASASPWFREHAQRADQATANYVLVAASRAAKKAKNKAKGNAEGAERLRQYWLHGKGALKIRWGTPGDWRRCRRQLSKYMGPRAAGYCSLLHKRATGMWTGDTEHRKSGGFGIKPGGQAAKLEEKLK